MQSFNKLEENVISMLTEYFTTCKISNVAKVKLEHDLPDILGKVSEAFNDTRNDVDNIVKDAVIERTKTMIKATSHNLREGEPEKPKTAHQMFVELVKADIENKLRAENPKFTSKMLRTALKDEWKIWKDTKKDQVDELKLTAKQEADRYKVELAEFEAMYQQQNPEEAKKYYEEQERKKAERKTRRSSKVLDKEKKLDSQMKAKSAYQLFSIDTRKEILDEGVLKGNDITTEVRRRWKELKAGNTVLYSKYMQMAKQEKERAEKLKSEVLSSYCSRENSEAGDMEIAEEKTKISKQPKHLKFISESSDSDSD